MEALSHVRVVELTDGVAASYCGRQFASWGAEVTCLEAEGGSPLRRREPLVPAPNGEEVSLLWENVAAGKRSVTHGSGGPAGWLLPLLDGADVFVSDWRRSRLRKAGLDLDALAAAHPRLVVLHVTPFGDEGPYADYEATEIVLQALAGFIYLNGEPGRYPLKSAGCMALYAAGVQAFVAGLAALQERRRSGLGQVVGVSCNEAVTSTVPLMRTGYSGVDGERLVDGPITGLVTFACRDGYISLNPGAGRTLEDLLVALEIGPDSLPPEMQTEHPSKEATRRFLEERLRDLPAAAVYHALSSLLVATGLVMGPAELLEDEHLRERGFFFDVAHPSLGRLRFPGPPAKLSATPMVPPGPAPVLLGIEGVEAPIAAEYAPHSVRPELVEGREPGARPSTGSGRTEEESPDEAWEGSRGDLPWKGGSVPGVRPPPLAGLRVLDLTHVWNGPYGAMLLADLGADVIKIEVPKHPDVWRYHGGAWPYAPANPQAHPWNTDGSFASVNRNKRDVWLDLAAPEGKAAFLRMLEDADLVLNNFTPRVMDNLGLGFETLRAVNPRITLVSFSGYGATGPYRNYRANGPTIETTCGWSQLMGYPGGPPAMMSVGAADPLSGLQLAAGALVALEAAERAGGQHVEGSMIETCIGYMGEEVLLASVTGKNPARDGNRDRRMVPHGVFPCAGADRWVAIAVRDDADWRRLVRVEGMADVGLADGRFFAEAGRRAAIEEVEERLGRWTSRRTPRQAMRALQTAGVPAGAVHRYSDIFDDEQLKALRWFIPMAHPDMGTHRYPGFAWRFTRSPAVVQRPPPRFGEHSVEVLSSLAGLSTGEMEEMIGRGVSGSLLERERVQEGAGSLSLEGQG